VSGPEPISAQEILALLGRGADEQVVITEMTGGYRNLIYRVQGEDIDCVIKQYAAPDDIPEDELRQWHAVLKANARVMLSRDPDA